MVRTRKRLAILVVTLAALAAASVAFAAWTGTGTGSGTARATMAVNATLTARDGTADLYPGATGNLYFTISNPNDYTIDFTSMTHGTITVTPGPIAGPPDCATTDITVTDGAIPTITAPPGDTDAQIDGVVTMSATAPDNCQGASFDIELTLTGTQA